MTERQAAKIVDAILADLKDRAGFCVECGDTTGDEEVRKDLIRIVVQKAPQA